jgi:hypothetical protein
MSTDQAAASRRPADAFPAITGLRFLPDDTPAELLNISETGLLAESRSRQLVGRPAMVQFEGNFLGEPVSGRVARCEVAAMKSDGLRYQIAIEFDSPLALDRQPASRTGAAANAVRNRW